MVISRKFVNARRRHFPGIRELLVSIFTLFAAFSLCATPTCAVDLRVGVDPDYPTIQSAISKAQAGDIIHLEEGKVYREMASFIRKKGEVDKPIVLDGHGAILDGSEALDPSKWREVEPGLFANSDMLSYLAGSVVGRWFFLWGGEVRRMGVASKATRAPFKKPSELKPGEWTFVRETEREEEGDGKRWKGTFYLKIDAGKSLADEQIFLPIRSAGVAMNGDSAHITIRNVTARYPYNDGFNIHGDCRNIRFENIVAYGCGDDGISAHETSEVYVKGLTSVGNSTGMCDVGESQTFYEDVYIADCVSIDVYFVETGRHSLKNAVVLSSSQRGFEVAGEEDGECRTELENVLFRRLVEPHRGFVNRGGVLDAKHCTIEGMEIEGDGTQNWQDSIVNGNPSEAEAKGADVVALEKKLTPTAMP